MKTGTFKAHLLFRGDVVEDGTVLDCVGDGEGRVLYIVRPPGGTDVNILHRCKADHLVEVTDHIPNT